MSISTHVYLFPPNHPKKKPAGMELGGWEDMFQILYSTEMENGFIFLLNAAEITDYIKKLIK